VTGDSGGAGRCESADARALARDGRPRIALVADVAQLVERRLPKPKVAGSRPVVRFRRESARPRKVLQIDVIRLPGSFEWNATKGEVLRLR
jgi:hypothetical protein